MTIETMYESNGMMTQFYKSYYATLQGQDEHGARDEYERMIAMGILEGFLDNGVEMYAHSKIMEEDQAQPMSGLFFEMMVNKDPDEVRSVIETMIMGNEDNPQVGLELNRLYAGLLVKIEKERRDGPVRPLTEGQSALLDYMCSEESMMNTPADMPEIERGLRGYIRFMTDRQCKTQLGKLLA